MYYVINSNAAVVSRGETVEEAMVAAYEYLGADAHGMLVVEQIGYVNIGPSLDVPEPEVPEAQPVKNKKLVMNEIADTTPNQTDPFAGERPMQSPFHPRQAALNLGESWSAWNGYLVIE